ncbi:nose resistant to fluoxetine protein 6 isoform X1 [Megachile rotundata]|uniref:nose resistant to fluoxetine protein 6 isoform X1 n=2 Tax=Megachile rotundata TaxID=143995 RepID=UPI003FD34C2A
MKYPRIRIILSLAWVCVSVQGYVQDPEVLKGSMPAYAITASIEQLNSTRCRTEMEKFRDSVDRGVLWSLRMLDASGVPRAGFTSGNNYWVGSRKQCNFLSQNRTLQLSEKNMKNNSVYRNPAEEFPPFRLHFFGAHIRHNGTTQYHIMVPIEDVIVLGLCLPASCTEHEVATMLNNVFDQRLLQVGKLYSTDFQLIKVSDMIDDHTWLVNGKIITIFCILAAILGIVIVGTFYDGLVHQKRLQNEKKFLAYENNNTSELKGEMEEKSEHDQEAAIPQELQPDSRVGQVLLMFSFYSNMKHIFNVGNSTESVASLHGLKFFGMIWIMIVHTIFYMLNIIGNKAEGYIMTNDVEIQILSNATLSVDTYLFISGFLLAFVFLKAQNKERKVHPFQRNAINFFSAIFKRYMRLTPAYLVTILLVIVNFSWYEQFTVWYFNEPLPELCSKYWWRNLLYINNFFGWSDLCLSWSWYLSNDMQFYIFGIFVLMLSTSYYYLSLGINIAILLVSTFLHGFVAYSIEYIPTLDMQYETLTYMYMRPWMRVQPYIVGMGTALLLTKWNYKLRLSKKALVTCWCLSILCNCSILFGVSDRRISLGLSIFYEAFSRLGWSVGIAWLVIACVTNNGGIVNKFLSLPYWVPFSRVSLCAYLLNPFLILSIGMYSNTSEDIDLLITGTICLGICVTSFACAFVLSAMTEVPVILFLRIISSFNRRIK